MLNTIDLKLPLWMVERIVAILREHPYTGAEDIIREIKKQIDNPNSEEKEANREDFDYHP